MAGTNYELASAENDGAKLIVRMSFESDRFATELLLATPTHSLVLLQSVEGTSDQPWPANGPLQEVVPQKGDAGDFLAGVGRGGKSHWSTIIAPMKDAAGIEFDFACRAKTEPDWLGSTYQILLEPTAIKAISQRIEIPVLSQRLVCTSLESAEVDMTGDGKICFTAVSSDATLPRTVRWKYRFELQPAPLAKNARFEENLGLS